jgi:hypothetical protein
MFRGPAEPVLAGRFNGSIAADETTGVLSRADRARGKEKMAIKAVTIWGIISDFAFRSGWS